MIKTKHMRAEKDKEISYKNQLLVKNMMKVNLQKNSLHPQNLLMSKAPSQGTLNSKIRIDELKRIWSDNQKMLTKI